MQFEIDSIYIECPVKRLTQLVTRDILQLLVDRVPNSAFIFRTLSYQQYFMGFYLRIGDFSSFDGLLDAFNLGMFSAELRNTVSRACTID
jgi:hypothetical protein